MQSFIVACSVTVTAQFTWSRQCRKPGAQPVEVDKSRRTMKFKMHFLIMIICSIVMTEAWNAFWISPKKQPLSEGERTVLNTCILVNNLQKCVANEIIALVLNLTRKKKVQHKKINL